MVKKLMLAVALVALVAAPAFAAVQNVKVGGSIMTASINRNTFDLGSNGDNPNNQNIIASVTTLGVGADLTDNVSTFVKMANERGWGINSGDTFYIDEANVTLKEFLYSPLTLKIGRQPLVYGNQFVIGKNSSNTNHFATVATDLAANNNFDAIKAVLTYDPLTVDLLASKVSEGSIYQQNDADDLDLYGVNANYKFGDKMNTVVEAYTFVRVNKTALTATNNETQNLYVPGLRVSTNPIEGLNLQLEGAYEKGTYGANDVVVRAFGLQGKVNYALPVLKDLNPVVSGGYTHLSGDKNTDDGKCYSFDPLYANQNVGRIFNALFTASNLRIAEVAIAVDPVKDVNVKLSWSNLAMDKIDKGTDGTQDINKTEFINQPFSSAVAIAHSTNKKDLGNEFDLDLSYAYTEDVRFAVSAGVFKPGKAFAIDGKDSASQVISSVSVQF